MKSTYLKSTTFIMLIGLTDCIARGQSWTNLCQPQAGLSSGAFAITTDIAGNVYVTGNSSAGAATYATIAYSSLGLPLWTNFYNGPVISADNSATAITAASNGNIYVTGHIHVTSSTSDYATIAYTATGIPLWTNRYNGPSNGDDEATGIAADTNGNVFVTGFSAGAGYDYATIKYSSAGAPLWTNRYNGSANGDDEATAIAVAGNGNVYVTGFSLRINNSDNDDYATIAYSNSGAPLWTNFYNGFVTDIATAIAVDAQGNIYVTGQSMGVHGNTNYVTIAYSGAGIPLWTNRYDDLTPDGATAIAVAGNGNVCVTGFSYLYSGCVTIAYSSAGVPLWTNVLANGPADNLPAGITTDAFGNVYVASTWAVNGQSTFEFSTVSYSSSGVPLWTNDYISTYGTVARAKAITVDTGNNVFVAGYAGSSGFDAGNYQFATIKYAAPVPSIISMDSNFGFKGGIFGFDVSGLAGSRAVVQSSPDLQTWLPLKTNTLVNGRFHFSDPSSPQSGTRFYRALPSP